MKQIKITGMDCPSCAALLELDLEEAGIKAKCSYPLSSIEVAESEDFDKIKKVVEKSGYKI
jgi:copper chaperone CopZ